MPLDARYRAASQTHAGLILLSTKTFPQDRNVTAAITCALSALLDQLAPIHPAKSCSSHADSRPPASIRFCFKPGKATLAGSSRSPGGRRGHGSEIMRLSARR